MTTRRQQREVLEQQRDYVLEVVHLRDPVTVGEFLEIGDVVPELPEAMLQSGELVGALICLVRLGLRSLPQTFLLAHS